LFPLVSGATKQNDSLFLYPNGKSHSSYFKPEFVPVFFDFNNLTFEDADFEKQARRVCGKNVQCLFDVKITGKTRIGVTSRKSLEEFTEILQVTERKGWYAIKFKFL
jgi:hypothetical protein